MEEYFTNTMVIWYGVRSRYVGNRDSHTLVISFWGWLLVLFGLHRTPYFYITYSGQGTTIDTSTSSRVVEKGWPDSRASFAVAIEQR
jgi:hypothetical protein